MKLAKYTVSIPLQNENKEVILYSLYEVCKFLDVSTTMVYRIMDGTCKYTHKKTQNLKGITIKKEELDEKTKKEIKNKLLGIKSEEQDEIDKETYTKELLKKLEQKVM